MPVRSLDSSLLKWPDRATVDEALRRWAADAAARNPELVRVGYIGSYARGDWGVGSDLDVVIVIERSHEEFLSRGRTWDLTGLPVPAEALVYTSAELAELTAGGGRFAETLKHERVWVYERDAGGSSSRAAHPTTPSHQP